MPFRSYCLRCAFSRVTPDSPSIVSSGDWFRWLTSWDSLSPVRCDRVHNLILHWKLTFWHPGSLFRLPNPRSSLTNPSNLQNAEPAAAELSTHCPSASASGSSSPHQSARRPAQAFYPMMGKFAKLIKIPIYSWICVNQNGNLQTSNSFFLL